MQESCQRLIMTLQEYKDLIWRHIKDAPLTVHCVVGAVSLYAFYRLVIKKKYKLPPGPRGLPLIGNLASLQNLSFLDKLIEWQKEYGDIFTISLGPMRTIMISEADLAIDAFVNHGPDFSDKPFFYSMHVLTDGSKSMACSSLGDTFKYQRKVASQSIRQYLTGTQFEERCHEVVLHLTKNIDAEKDVVLLKDVLSLGVFNVMHGLCFGTTKELDDPGLKTVFSFIHDFNHEAGNGFLEDVFPILRFWPTKKFTRLSKIFLSFTGYLKERVEERRIHMDRDNPRCLADTILIAQQELKETDQASSSHITDVHATMLINDMFGGGLESLCTTLDWIFLVLVAYPDIQARMHKEIDDVIGEKIPGREHRSKLVYTEAVILETMRLYSAAPFSGPHLTRADATVGGYDIPAKSSVMIIQHMTLRDPRHWENPLTFKPERFMNEDESKVVLRNRSFFPFSLGPRGCPGEAIAKLCIVYLVVGLLQKYSFSLPPGDKADFTPKTDFFGFQPNSYKVIATPR